MSVSWPERLPTSRTTEETSVRLSWILGLQRLGFEVHVIEEGGQDGISYLQQVEGRVGLTGLINLVTPDGEVVYGRSKVGTRRSDSSRGLPRQHQWQRFGTDGIERVSHPRLYRRRSRLHAVLACPGKLGTTLLQHDAWFTVGGNVGTPASPVPTGGIRWLPVLPPVVLSEWPIHPAQDQHRMTTIASWRGAFAAVEVDGHRYGVKAHEWRRVFSLPSLAQQHFEIALAIDQADARDRAALVDTAGTSSSRRWPREIQIAIAHTFVHQAESSQPLRGFTSKPIAAGLVTGRRPISRPGSLSSSKTPGLAAHCRPARTADVQGPGAGR